MLCYLLLFRGKTFVNNLFLLGELRMESFSIFDQNYSHL
jgi:hypothetical protein